MRVCEGPKTTYIAQRGGIVVIARRLHLVEVVFIELSDEARHVAMLEVLGEDRPGELLAL